MIGYCLHFKREVLSEACCVNCKSVDLTLCRHWETDNRYNVHKMAQEIIDWQTRYNDLVDTIKKDSGVSFFKVLIHSKDYLLDYYTIKEQDEDDDNEQE